MPKLFGGEDSYRNVTTQESGFNSGVMNQFTSIIPNKQLKSKEVCYLCLVVIPHYTFGAFNSNGYTYGRSLPAPIGFNVGRVSSKEVNFQYLSQPHLDGDYSKESPPWNNGWGIYGVNH